LIAPKKSPNTRKEGVYVGEFDVFMEYTGAQKVAERQELV
jgi:hypothetical protein